MLVLWLFEFIFCLLVVKKYCDIRYLNRGNLSTNWFRFLVFSMSLMLLCQFDLFLGSFITLVVVEIFKPSRQQKIYVELSKS